MWVGVCTVGEGQGHDCRPNFNNDHAIALGRCKNVRQRRFKAEAVGNNDVGVTQRRRLAR